MEGLIAIFHSTPCRSMAGNENINNRVHRREYKGLRSRSFSPLWTGVGFGRCKFVVFEDARRTSKTSYARSPWIVRGGHSRALNWSSKINLSAANSDRKNVRAFGFHGRSVVDSRRTDQLENVCMSSSRENSVKNGNQRFLSCRHARQRCRLPKRGTAPKSIDGFKQVVAWDNSCGAIVIILFGVPGSKKNPLGALVNIVCCNGQMATHCCYPIAALCTSNSIG